MRLLRARFGRVTPRVEDAIAATDDLTRLDAWLDKFVTAQTIADFGISAARGGPSELYFRMLEAEATWKRLIRN